jgi:hypothetical protein
MAILDKNGKPFVPPAKCEHKSVAFDADAACGLGAQEVRKRWPRFQGRCSCGFFGVAYASPEHYTCGDW